MADDVLDTNDNHFFNVLPRNSNVPATEVKMSREHNLTVLKAGRNGDRFGTNGK